MKNSRWMRFLLITLSVVMVLSLFACGDNGSEEETTVGNNEETTVGGGDETTVGGDDETTVGGDDETTVGGGDETTVGGDDETTVGGDDETTVGGDDETTVGGGDETTVPEPVYEGNWFVSVDAFFADMDSYLGNYGAGDYSEIDTLIMGACTNNNSQIIANVDGAYPSVTGNYICLFGGWIAVDGQSTENFVCTVYAADGTVLKTVELGMREGEEGLAGVVQGMLNYSSTTTVPRVGGVDEMIDLSEFAGQTVTVVYSADVVGTEFTLDMIKVDVEVPAPLDSNVSLTPDKLAGITNVTNVGSITLSEDGSYVTVKPAEGANDIYFYAYHGNTAVSGRYAIIKYRTSANVTEFNVYASTSRDGATDGDDLTTAYIVADGEWHVMLVDLANVKTVEADENGEYTVKFLRIDPFRGVGNATGAEEVDIAYVGVHDSVADLDVIANSSNILELGNQFTFSVDSVSIAGNVLTGLGFNGSSVKAEISVPGENANVVFTAGWIAVNGHAFTDMGLYYQIVDENGNATKITNAGMNIMAAEEGVITHCATANPGATPMRIDPSKGGLVLPDLAAYHGQTVTVYIYAISDTMWAEHGVIAGRVVLALTINVEKIPQTLTIPEALEIGKAAGSSTTADKYYTTGVITGFYGSGGLTYGNVYIEDEDGNVILVYGLYSADGSTRYDKMEVKPKIGDTIKVLGALTSYNGVGQFKNAWLMEHEIHECTEWTEATCQNPATCTHCGATKGSTVDHVYVDGECKWCGLSENAKTEVVTDDFASKTASTSYSSGTTAKGWAYKNCAIMQGGTGSSPTFSFIGANNSVKAFVMNGKTSAKGSITSPKIDNVCSISFNYGHPFGDSKVSITITVTDANGKTVSTTLTKSSISQKTAYEFTWDLDGEVMEGACTITISNNSPSNSTSNKDRLAIWNVEVTSIVG